MSVKIRLEVIPRTVPAVEVPDDMAADLAEVYKALAELPADRCATTDPFTAEGYEGPAKIDGNPATTEYKAAWNARRYVRQGKAWCATQTGPNGRPLVFARKGDIKGNPSVVSFRIYEQRERTQATGQSDEDSGEAGE